MRLTSLRSKIFLLVGLTLLVVAVAVLLVTQRNVTRSVVASEQQAVRNVLNLLVRDSEARWGALLNDKILTVRNGRSHLVQLGATVRSVLDMFAEQVERRQITTTEAQDLAKKWINGLNLDKGRYAFVFNRDLIALASGKRELLGMSLATVKDFKGHDLAASAYQEARTTGQSFAIYRWPSLAGDGQGELRYAYFAYFEPWDWIFAITDSAREVSEQFDRRRNEMETAVSEALGSLRLADSGFAFILRDDDELVSPLPAMHAGMLDEREPESRSTLRDLLRRIPPPNGDIATFTFDSPEDKSDWEISASRFKPLGWTIVAAVPTDDLTRPATALRFRLGTIFLGVLGLSLLVAWAMSARITRPLQQLSDFARKLPEQDLSAAADIPDHIAQLPRKQPDEVGRLAATFIFMDQQLREKIASLVQETSSRERLQSELSIAHDIQMGLLPVPLEQSILDKIDLYATMLPAKEVGGDLYDYFLLNNGKLCFVIGDVSDKGVPAALFMAVTRTLVRACAEDETDPAQLMERVNNRLAENNPNLMFVTLILAVVDLESGELAWANAGHPPLCVLQRNGELRMLEGRSGPACGVQDGLPYRLFTAVLEPGETVLGYTDGVTEALNPAGELYGESRLFEFLARRPPADAQATTDALIRHVREFAHDTDQSDDITVIAAKRADP
ncbi:SpoIIE family protein phosphatase [Parapusillimonas granuli]|uniref:SpoIIE family protein phosphatase n=1 Tax=Parapusillimonas granuli TaxID=380911 RepID=A0A853FYX1_9BURK|nr:SpoIIE family protein phosphatase [Parapusillimonas granuli]MBB5214730.1 sigma-B regulation protein RsbU (phosphoserine phosphatase) [Parapusillimonas granuli]MEB2398022.1 SpoIIE family protein phosphatase [Alcaligenaceae bacterium]NYT48862.1 SpoIIE family protein phosphatase [Parapusillimonas granuli]